MDSGFISTIVMGGIVLNLHPEKDAVIQWHTYTGNITNNHKVKLYFTLPALSVTNFMTWKFHVGESSKSRYDMILGQDLLI